MQQEHEEQQSGLGSVDPDGAAASSSAAPLDIIQQGHKDQQAKLKQNKARKEALEAAVCDARSAANMIQDETHLFSNACLDLKKWATGKASRDPPRGGEGVESGKC